MSELFLWHSTNKSSNGLVHHVVESKAWAHVDEKWQNFVVNLGNLRLVISIDGCNPFFEKLCQWFTWHVYVLIYNLLLWLTTKYFFMLVVLIISSKKNYP
jgi:hypothetical protein